jgi:hypothetical protein
MMVIGEILNWLFYFYDRKDKKIGNSVEMNDMSNSNENNIYNSNPTEEYATDVPRPMISPDVKNAALMQEFV